MNRRPATRRAVLAVVALLAAVLATGAVSTPSSGACAASTSKKLAGTIEGQDHRYVRAQVSVELFDAAERAIGLDGCPISGYARSVNVNTDLPDALGTNSASGHTKAWEVTGLPANAVLANVEVYPKGPSGTDLTRYGRAFRHNRVPGDTSVDIDLPLNCGFADNAVFGRNGSIEGTVTKDGHPIETYRVSAFSIADDTEAMPLGFGIDSSIPDGHFSVDALAPNQSYLVFLRVTSTSTTQKIWFVRVEPCTATRLDYVVGKFQDVPYSHPFFDEITWMLDEDLTTGYPGDVYRPSAEVTRQAVSAWLHRLAGSPSSPAPDPGFSDVPPSHPFRTEIAWMAATGRAEGFADGTFRPQQCVTRQAMAAFLHREQGSPPPGPPAGFSDVPAGHPFVTAITWAANAGVTTGYPDGTFRPGDCVTRQAAAAFLNRTAA